MSDPRQASLKLPQLRPDQMKIAKHKAKVKVIACGRRYGKTFLGGAIGLLTAFSGGHVAWVVPLYKNSRPLWRFCLEAVQELERTGKCHVDKAERVITFPNNGSIGIYSAENADSILGEAFHLVIIDEAARISDDAYYRVIVPTVGDYDGEIILISTPRGLNWFYTEYVRGLDHMRKAEEGGVPYMASFSAPTNANPMPTIQRAYERARETLPGKVFRQEWEARFEGDGALFSGVRECVYGPYRDYHAQAPKGEYVIGVDLASTVDYSVFTVIDINTREVVEVVRIQNLEYDAQLIRLTALASKYKAKAVVIEANANRYFVQMASQAIPGVIPFTTTNVTKAAIIHALMVAIETRSIGLPDDEVFLSELLAFESRQLPGGGTRYAAPDGQHDDCVISLALAWYAVESEPGWESVAI